MKPPPFKYLRPDSLETALTRLAEWGDEAKLLAGGQSLVPLLNFRLARPSVLIDLSAIEELAFIDRMSEALVLGSMTRQQQVQVSSLIRRDCPLLPRAVSHIGHAQIRNRGTVGGSIAHADPAAELPAVALTLGAEMVLRSATGERVVSSNDFFKGPFATALAQDEILVAVRVPVDDGWKDLFVELARRPGDFAVGGIVGRLRLADGDSQHIEDIRLVAFGVGGVPTRLAQTESVLRSRKLDSEAAGDASREASREIDPLTDVHGDATYRRELIGALLSRALEGTRDDESNQ